MSYCMFYCDCDCINFNNPDLKIKEDLFYEFQKELPLVEALCFLSYI